MWADQLVNGRMVIWEKGDAEYKRRNGGKELIRIIEATRERRYDAFGVICYAKDVTVLRVSVRPMMIQFCWYFDS